MDRNNKIFLLGELTAIFYANYVSKFSFVLSTNMAAVQTTYFIFYLFIYLLNLLLLVLLLFSPAPDPFFALHSGISYVQSSFINLSDSTIIWRR